MLNLNIQSWNESNNAALFFLFLYSLYAAAVSAATAATK